jgi:hypothetical protein
MINYQSPLFLPNQYKSARSLIIKNNTTNPIPINNSVDKELLNNVIIAKITINIATYFLKAN